MKWNTKLTSNIFGAILGLAMGFASTAHAVELDLETSPLFLSNQSDPNVFFEIDDSGSMDWEILTKKHWHICAYNDGTDGCGWLVTNGLYRDYTGSSYQYFEYIFDNGDDAYSNSCNSSRQTLELCSSTVQASDWRVKSSANNVLYFNPDVEYKPWKKLGGTPVMGDADFDNARSDPESTSTGFSETRDLAGFVYNVWTDSHGFSGAQPNSGTVNKTTGANGLVDWWDEHQRITVDASSITVEQITYTGAGFTETVSSTTTLTGSGAHPELGGKTIDEVQDSIANWYQYHRRRSFATKAAVAEVINENPSFRYGLSVINEWGTLFQSVPSAGISDYTLHNQTLINSLFSFNWPARGTPLRTALKRTGDYFDDNLTGKADPIISECQKNFTILFTDGYWNGGSPSVGDEDGDGLSNTVADVAMKYYDTDLSPLADNVPSDSFDSNKRQHMVTFTVAFGIEGLLTDTDSDGLPNPALTEPDDWGDPFNSNPEKVDDLWHAAFNSKGTFVSASTPSAVVDSLNDALENIDARTSSAASVALNAGSIGANSRVYQAKFDTDKWSGQVLSFTVNLDGSVNSTANWDAGCKITGGSCPTTGSTETGQNWNSDRKIITYKPSNGAGIPFRWPAAPATPSAVELDKEQTDALNIDLATGLTDTQGESRLEYLRGNRALEATTFRVRDSVLGDVIHSAPVYIGPPTFNYPDSLEAVAYSTYRDSHKGRQPIVWFGANDGLFHGVDASLISANQGKEVLAYMPSQMYSGVNELSSPSYVHKYFVDGIPTAGDVFFGSSWKTVIVSSLAAGGQGLFSLDVTNPSTFSEANADNISLWEFTDGPSIGTTGSFTDRDMGYSYGQASIVKLQNGVWAAIFGNGYGNTHDDDNDGTTTNDSLTGNSVIYIVNVQTGALISKFDTGVGSSADPLGASRPNGMSSPTVVDVDNDKKADYIYAGDLFGNVWKIDITGASSSSWKFDYSTTAPHTPLFVTDDGTGVAQPITTSPEVSKHPNSGFLVNIGTGKYLETGDNSQIGQQTQSFYGLWDKNQTALTAFTRSHLLKQEISKEEVEQFDINQDGTRGASEGESDVRETTKNSILWHTGPGLPIGSTHLGWYIDLFSKIIVDKTTGIATTNSNNFGERQVTGSTLIDGVIFFNTLIPSDNPCDFGGDSWIMALNADSGERVDDSVFDLDLNGIFDAGDGFDGGPLISGVKSKVGILPRLTFAKGYTGDSYFAFGSGSSGGFMNQQLKRSSASFGRQSWDQILE